jgi:endonuclease G, mitochondrial
MLKYLFTLLLLILTSTSFSQVIEVKGDIFDILYSETLEQPIRVRYKVLCDGTGMRNSRKGLYFYKNDSIHTSDNKDYYKNVWDKGHMAPAADFNCDKKDLKETFSYLNCALQHQDLNRRTWRYLEAHERNIATRYDVYVIIHIIFSENSKRLPTGATVPDAFKKTIYVDGEIYGVWYFENKSIKDKNYNLYKQKWKTL